MFIRTAVASFASIHIEFIGLLVRHEQISGTVPSFVDRNAFVIFGEVGLAELGKLFVGVFRKRISEHHIPDAELEAVA